MNSAAVVPLSLLPLYFPSISFVETEEVSRFGRLSAIAFVQNADGGGSEVWGALGWRRGHVVKDREQCREPSVTLLHRRQRGLNESNNKAACHVE